MPELEELLKTAQEKRDQAEGYMNDTIKAAELYKGQMQAYQVMVNQIEAKIKAQQT